MDLVGSSAQSAVDSLLGRLSSVLVEEAQLLRRVHGDVDFIKREMESMNGFLLDAADEDGIHSNSNQVRVWRRQVHELAYDSQSCVDRYVQTFGASRPMAGAGLLASVCRVPELVRTLPNRYRIASEIRGLKARSVEVADRRQRYGVVMAVAPTRGGAAGALASRRAAIAAKQEADNARRRHALDSAASLFDVDARAKELVAWLMGKPPPVPRGRLRRNQLVTAGQLLKKLVTGGGGPHDGEDLSMELIKLFRGLYGNDDPENVVEAAGYLREAMLEVGKQEVKVIGSWLLDKLLGRADMAPQEEEEEEEGGGGKAGVGQELLLDMAKALKGPMDKLIRPAESFSLTYAKSVLNDLLELFTALKEPLEKFLRLAEQDSSSDKKDGSRTKKKNKHPTAGAANQDLLEVIKAAKEPMEVARAEARYMAEQIRWLLRVFRDDFLEEHVYHHGHRPRPKVVAIVTPPAEDAGNDDDEPAGELLLQGTHATELAKKVYDNPSASNHFDTKVWVNARRNKHLKPRLMSILHQVLLGGGCADNDLEPTKEEKRKWAGLSPADLKAEISNNCAKVKRLLIVLADPEDDNAWQDITHALPDHVDSAIIVTPTISQMAQFDGWYTASWFFLFASSRYRVHFCSNLVGLRKVAAELVGSDQVRSSISGVLKKCLWDPFTTNMFLHALYANPHRSDAELERLMLGLRSSSVVANARRMVMFCYDDLPRQYQRCLLCLSIFPEGQILKRASLVRRWAAENFVSARDGLTAVDEADRCFDALVARGLLEPANVGPAGKVKSCTLRRHVMSFVKKMASSDAVVVGSTDGLPPDLAHRLSTRSGVTQLLLQSQAAAARSSNTCGCWGGRGIGTSCRRGRGTGSGGDSSQQEKVVTFLISLPASSDQLGLVKLLDLEGCKGLKKRHLKKICNKIFQLKYLSLRNTDATELPKEIGKLRYLETLDIRQTKIESFHADTIALPKLMHLLAGRTDPESSEAIGSDRPFSTVRLPSNIESTTNLQVLSHVQVSKSNKDELTKVGQKLHLRKLGVVIRGEQPLSALLQLVRMLHESLCSLSIHLHQPAQEGDGDNGAHVAFDHNAVEIPRCLESLNIKGQMTGLPIWITQLHRLSKVTLCRTSLRGEDIHKLGELANLRCIRLWHQSCADNKLVFNTRALFRKLELLAIEDSTISDIDFAANAAPSLKKIDWRFTGKNVTLSGIQRLLNLQEVHVSGNCEDSCLSKIKKDLKENPNLPTFKP